MTITDFAKQHRLKVERDTNDETIIISGRLGESHLFEYDDARMGVAVIPDTDRPHRWTAARKAFRNAGMTITQNGDCEGIATFDPDNQVQVRAALDYADVRRRREPSSAQLEVLAKARLARQNSRPSGSAQEGDFEARNADLPQGDLMGLLLANVAPIAELSRYEEA